MEYISCALSSSFISTSGRGGGWVFLFFLLLTLMTFGGGVRARIGAMLFKFRPCALYVATV